MCRHRHIREDVQRDRRHRGNTQHALPRRLRYRIAPSVPRAPIHQHRHQACHHRRKKRKWTHAQREERKRNDEQHRRSQDRPFPPALHASYNALPGKELAEEAGRNLITRIFHRRPMTTAEPTATGDTERLAKLWEAYKVQEEELQDALARAQRAADDLTDAGRATHDRERAIADRDAEIRRLHETLAHKDARIRELEQIEEDARAIAMYKDRIAELEAAHAQEKERLAKLFLLYEQATKK